MNQSITQPADQAALRRACRRAGVSVRITRGKALFFIGGFPVGTHTTIPWHQWDCHKEAYNRFMGIVEKFSHLPCMEHLTCNEYQSRHFTLTSKNQ